MFTPEEHKKHSDYLRGLGIERQEDIDAVLDFIYSLATIAVEVVSNEDKQDRHPYRMPAVETLVGRNNRLLDCKDNNNLLD